MNKEELVQKIGNLECEIHELKARLLKEQNIKADLLGALKELLSVSSNPSYLPATKRGVEDKARAAIAKATGETS